MLRTPFAASWAALSFSVLFAQDNTSLSNPARNAAITLTPQALNTWSLGTAMPTKRQYPFTGAIGPNIYVIGGASGSSVLTVNEVYNTATDTWSTAAPMPTARWDGASAVVNNILYAIGGATANNELSVVEAYDPVTNTWSTKTPMPAANDSIYATVVNNIIYVVGGCCNSGGIRFTSVLAYNPVTDSWSAVAPLKVAKSQSALGFVGSKIVSAGGLLASSNATTDAEAYDPATNSWATLPALPTARQGGCFGTDADTLFFAGGHNGGNGGALATMNSYDAGTNAWTTALPSMPYAAVNPGSASVGGRLYCFGGSDAGNPFQGNLFDYVQVYQPNLPPVISPGGIVSASAYGEFLTAAAGSWIEIYGANLAADTRGWAGSDFNVNTAPTALDATTVTIAGQPAFVEYISPGEVNALLPSNVPAGLQQLTVTTSSGASATYDLTINATLPGFLAPPSFKIGGVPYIVGIFTDGAYALPAGAIAGVNSRPARPGDIVTLYGIGFGPVVPASPAGQIVQQATNLASNLQMQIGGAPVSVLYAGLAPDFTGLYQFNIMVPAVAAGNQPLTITLGGTAGTQTLYVPIGQ